MNFKNLIPSFFFKSKKIINKSLEEPSAYNTFLNKVMQNNKITENLIIELNNNLIHTNENFIIKYIKKHKTINLAKKIISMTEEEKLILKKNDYIFPKKLNQTIESKATFYKYNPLFITTLTDKEITNMNTIWHYHNKNDIQNKNKMPIESFKKNPKMSLIERLKYIANLLLSHKAPLGKQKEQYENIIIKNPGLFNKLKRKLKNNTFVSYSPKYIWQRIRNRMRGLSIDEIEG